MWEKKKSHNIYGIIAGNISSILNVFTEISIGEKYTTH